MTENLNEPSWTKVGVFPPYLVVQGGIRNEPIKLKVFFNGYMVSENDFEVWTYYYHFDFVFRDLLKGTVHAYTGGFYTEYTYPPNVCFKSAFAPWFQRALRPYINRDKQFTQYLVDEIVKSMQPLYDFLKGNTLYLPETNMYRVKVNDRFRFVSSMMSPEELLKAAERFSKEKKTKRTKKS